MILGCVILRIMFKGWEIIFYFYWIFDIIMFEWVENNWENIKKDRKNY